MKLQNNHGITLIELVISIALISIVIMFLFRLVVDVRYGDNNTDFNRENQQTRAIIIKTVQQDFLEKKLVGIVVSSDLTSGVLTLNFNYANRDTGRFSLENMPDGNQSVTYTKNGVDTEKWIIKKSNSSSKFNVACTKFSSRNIFEDIGGDFFYIRISIPMEVRQSSKNYIDDLEFFYIGEKKDVIVSNFSPIIGGNSLPANC